MENLQDLQLKTLLAARDSGIASMLFRNTLAKKLGLNLTESLCLTILGIEGSSTPTRLASYTGLTTGATTTMLDRLESRKFIVRKANPKDRRGVIIETHPDYAETAKQLVAGVQKAHKNLIASYSEAELKLIAGFLQKFTANMQLEAEELEKLQL